MPYRRLPNTDSARLRAMEAVLQKGNLLSPNDLAISQAMLLKLRAFLPFFKQAVDYQRETLRRQTQNSKTYLDIQKRAKLYISHFIQVLNLAVIRGEQKPAARKFYGLRETQRSVPPMNTEADIIAWGERVVKGEAERLSTGASPITNPTAALVRVRYEDFLRTYHNQKNLQEVYVKATTKVSALRDEADALIVDLWNQVEARFADLPPREMRDNARGYGVQYVFRKNEPRDDEPDAPASDEAAN